MRIHGRAGNLVASALAAFFVVSGLCGAVCEVAVCYENCDPCVSQCRCRRGCDHGAAGSEASHKLSSYRLSIADEPEGGVVRTLSEISGLSLDFADGPREHTAADFARFARGVIEVNGLLLQPRRGSWKPSPVEVFESAVLVPFAGDAGGATLTFCFDRSGNLVEIDEVRPGR